MIRYLNGASALAISATFAVAPNAVAQQADTEATAAPVAGAARAEPKRRRLKTVTVTATKRTETAQDIPVTVNALGEQELGELDVKVFTDYLQQLPGVSAGGSGPGQKTIYIRGLASTTPNLTVAGVAGLAPNVAFYLDEQPLAQPGRNLDVYAADLERIEKLSGPQGTLFGASSQAGTVRLITNKPVLGEFLASVKGGTSFTEGGEMSNNIEAMINLPVTDKFALRGVVYTDNQGGYIDNVAGTRDASESGRFRPEGTVRANGVPVSANRAGIQSTSDLSGVNFLEANNSALVEEDFNDTTYSGFRISGRYEFSNDWMLDVAHTRQQLDTDGVFFTDPELGDTEIQRFSDDSLEDSFNNTSWTLQGRLGMLEAVYTGAWTERDSDQTVDYSDYLFVGQYLPDYICDYSVVYPAGSPSGTCQTPNLFVDSVSKTEVLTQELRFNTPAEHRFRATAGAFYSDLELKERNDFTYPGSISIVNSDGSVGFGALPANFPLTNGDATPGNVGNETQGFFTDPGPLPPGVAFRNDIKRTDEQFGIFGEATFDVVPDLFSLIVGARYYDVEVDLEGSANSSFDILFAGIDPDGNPVDAQAFGTNISQQFSGNGPEGAPDTASTDGVIYKATAQYTPTPDMLFYATFSQGFRPGLLNRPGGRDGPDGFVVPFAIDTDDVDNFELGWKTELFQNSLRLNGSAFFVDISDLQTTIFDPSITNLFFSDNAADAEIFGVEGDFTWAPIPVEGLTVSGAFSFLDTEITKVLTPTDDVLEGGELAFAPEFQGNLRARYEWPLAFGGRDYTAHVMPQVVYSSSSFSDIIEINKAKLDSYGLVHFAAGLSRDNWSVEAFVRNITDEDAELSNDFVFDRERVSIARPRTYGVRFSVDL